MVPPASVDPIGLLRLALDPAALLTAAGLTPDPWQQQLLRCQARQVLLVGSRQAGKSTAVAALALHTALFRRRSLTLLLSPSLRQSAELLRKVVDLHRAVGSLVPARFQSQTRLELANESRVISLPSREETVRSFSNVGLLLLDEAARIPDELYRAVRPMLAASRGRIICLSTPFGQRGFFWHEWTAGGPAWQRFRVGVGDCPRISPEFLAEERRALGDSWVRQEYECSFESLEGLVFPDFEQRCGVDDGPDGSGRPWVGGIDFGFRNPFAAVWGFTDADDVLWIVGERYARERPLHEHLPHLPRQVVWYADPTGRQEIEALRHAGLTVRRGGNDLRAGIAAVTARLETGRLRVRRQAAPNLLAEARLYRYPRAADGRPIGEEPIDAHNHALAALRYVIARLDAAFLARWRTGEPAAAGTGERPWLSLENDLLWHR